MKLAAAWHRGGKFALGALLLLGGIGLSVMAKSRSASPPLPWWLEGRAELLPPVSAGTLKTVKTLVPQADSVLSHCLQEPLTSQEIHAAKRLYAMKDEVGQAMLWWYAEDAPPGTDKCVDGLLKSALLHEIGNDPTLTRWLLPLLRRRVDLAELQFKAGRIDKSPFSGHELDSIHQTMVVMGTPEDAQRIHQFWKRLKQSGTKAGEELIDFPPAYHEDLEAIREGYRQDRGRYYSRFAWVVREAAAHRSWMETMGTWLLWPAVGLAVAGVVVWLVRRRVSR